MRDNVYTFHPENVDQGLHRFVHAITREGRSRGARDGSMGETKELPRPSVITWRPEVSIVSLSETRDANPFFHLFEAMHMLAGMEDLDRLIYFNSSFGQFSDDGKKINGSAYGVRWRSWFESDQLVAAADHLAHKPHTRRTVVQMWDARHDLPIIDVSKDVPCNTQIYFELIENSAHGYDLNMTVTNRSNDAVYGLFGANVVHFSILHAYMVMMINERRPTRDVRRGLYYQFTNNGHGYVNNEVFKKIQNYPSHSFETTVSSALQLPSSCSSAVMMDHDLGRLMDWILTNESPPRFVHPWMTAVVEPMMTAWKIRKNHGTQDAYEFLRAYEGAWVEAGTAWLKRRIDIKAAKVAAEVTDELGA